MANSVDQDQMLHFVASDLGLHSFRLAKTYLSQYLGLLRYIFISAQKHNVGTH